MSKNRCQIRFEQRGGKTVEVAEDVLAEILAVLERIENLLLVNRPKS